MCVSTSAATPDSSLEVVVSIGESETGDAPVDGRLAPQSSRRSQRARSKGSSARSLGGASYRSRSARDVLRSRSAELAPLALVGLAPPGAMDLQAELAKIDCAAHAPALLAAGMLWDEVRHRCASPLRL